MLIYFLTLVASLAALYFSTHRFIQGSASLARLINLSPLLIGLIIVGFAASLPEIFISVFAAYDGSVNLALGNALGSTIANIGLILAATALIQPLLFDSKLLKKQLLVLVGVSIMGYFVSFDGLGRGDSALMLLMLLIFLVWLIRSAKREEFTDSFEKELKLALPDTLLTKKAWLYSGLGLMGIVASSKLLVWSAVKVAGLSGLGELVTGLTILAIGSSLPELGISIRSALKKEDDLAVGHIIGANIYNVLLVYAMPGFIAPGEVAHQLLMRDFPVMLTFIVVLFVLTRSFSPKTGVINRWEAAILLLGFASYQWVLYQSVTTVALSSAANTPL